MRLAKALTGGPTAKSSVENPSDHLKFKALQGMAPVFTSDLLLLYEPTRVLR